jgi:hypothetical protein
MANVPAKPRNTKGEPPSQADTEHGFNPTRKVLMAVRHSLTYTLIWS